MGSKTRLAAHQPSLFIDRGKKSLPVFWTISPQKGTRLGPEQHSDIFRFRGTSGAERPHLPHCQHRSASTYRRRRPQGNLNVRH